MDDTFIGVSLSPAASQLLSENEIDLVAELRKQQLDVNRAERPIESQNRGLKSVELVILASAVAAPLVAHSISNIFEALDRRRRAVVTETSQAIEGASSERTFKASFLGLRVELTEKREVQ